MAVPMAAALVFLLAAWRLGSADLRIAQVRAMLDRNNVEGAAQKWLVARNASLGSDLYFARRWMSLASESRPALERLQVSQMALDAAQAATQTREQVHNAWYNLAILEAAANNSAAVENSLRSAIAAAPTWYKPHWTLARFLLLSGRTAEAQAEARKALELNAHHDAEVTETMDEILRSGTAPK
jgi:tetratricopeptide (TPR) repeat protein